MVTPIFIALVSFFISCGLFYFGRALAKRAGLTDAPGGRKQHVGKVPLIGGLIILPVFIVSLFFIGQAQAQWVILCAAVFLLLMGVIDDAAQINPWMKFAVQMFVSCFVVIFGGLEVDSLGNLFGLGEIKLGYFAKPFSVMCLVLLMNAVNMMDGLDGLAGGLAAVMMAVMMAACFAADALPMMGMMAMLLAPLCAFLVFNMRYPGHARASVFMGDAGSLTLGLLLGWFAITLSQAPHSVLSPAVVPWIVGLPVADALALYVYRTMNGKQPFEPDRNHLHHRFVDNGVAPGRATFLLLLFKLCGAAAALAAFRAGVPDVFIFALWLAFFFTHMALSFRPQGYAALLRRFA